MELSQDGLSGYGEAGESDYYGATRENMTAALEQVRSQVETVDLNDPAGLWAQLRPYFEANTFAQCALDMAAWDLWGKLRGEPVWKLFGLELHSNLPPTDYTLGIDAIEVMVRKMEEFPGWPIYKIKLGTPEDLAIVAELRKHTVATFRVDANAGWTAEEAIRKSAILKDLGVEFIEQPLPHDRWDDMRRVYRESALPTIADESCRTEADVDQRGRVLSRGERETGEMRRPYSGPANAAPRPATRLEDDGRLHDRIDGRHLGGGAAPAAAGLRRPRWRCCSPKTSPPA